MGGGGVKEVKENLNKPCLPSCLDCSPTLRNYPPSTQDRKKNFLGIRYSLAASLLVAVGFWWRTNAPTTVALGAFQ